MNRVKKLIVKMIPALFTGLVVALSISIATYADGKLTVSVASAYVRASASTSAAVVGGVNKSETYDILETQSDGTYKWYKIQVSDTVTGYVRSDLVTTEGTATETPATSTTTQTTTEQTVVTEVVPVAGKVTGDVRVRAGASTNHDVVTSAVKDTAVTVIGYATASDGKVWYNVTYSSTAGDVTGFIRNDYLKLEGELVEKTEEPEPTVTEPEPVVEPEPEPVVYKDYEAVYSEEDDTWYLNNYIEGTKRSIPELLEAKTALEKKQTEFSAQLKKQKVLIGFLIAAIIALIAVGVYAFIRFRAWYYSADEDTEEPAHTSTRSNPVERPVNTARTGSTSNVRLQTVGAEPKPAAESRIAATEPRTAATEQRTTASANASRASLLGGEQLPDGTVRMPDGSIRKKVYAVKLSDGSIKYPDGTIKRPDGTIVKPGEADDVKPYAGSSSQEVRQVRYAHTSETNNDDDMEFGFLSFDKNSDK